MINLGNIELADLRLGASQVKAAYFGSKQIWGGEEPVPVGDWLCFTAEEANSTVKLYKYNGGAPTLDIETSTDGQNWSAYTQGTVLSAANVGDKVYFRAGSTGNPTVSNTNKTNRFAITGKMAASGDLQYLLSQDGTTQPTGAWCFNCLFQYQTGLTEPPKCGAITLGTECYGGTFEGCTNLRHAPELNATNFVGQKVYINMFVGCTSLTTAPKLPATTLTTYCYNGMFDGCTSLSSVEVAFTTWTPNTSINWLRNVAASGTFTCPAELPDIRGINNIPEGWQIVHPQQELSAVCFTALENNSNIRLDKKQHAPNVSLEYSTDGGSTWSEYTWSSSTGPTITLATTGDKVYFRAKNDNQYLAQDINVGNYDRSSHWFASSAGKLKVSGNLNTLLSANNTPRDLDVNANKAAFSMLFNECANLYDATELSIPSMVISEGCYQCLFRKCTNLSAGPLELPATTLASGCYNNLFENCNNILSVPAFPAAQTVNDCYAYMLYNCHKLNSISVGLTAWGGTNQWTNGVSSTGTFYCPSTLPENRGGSAIPNGWTVVHPSAYPTEDLKLHFDAIDNAGVGSHLSSTQDWANIAPDTSADYKLHRTSGTWEDDSAVFTGAYDECFWLRNSSNAQIDNLFSSLNMLSSSWTYAIGLYYNPATIENYRGYIGQQQSYTSYAQIYLRTDLQVSWLLLGYKQNGTSTGSQDTYFEGSAPNFKDSFTQNAFNTMVGTWDAATATFKVYVNGQLEFTWQSPGGAVVLGHELPLTLGGGQQQSGNNRTCKGKIHDFLVYSRALSDAEVAQLHAYQDARFNS